MYQRRRYHDACLKGNRGRPLRIFSFKVKFEIMEEFDVSNTFVPILVHASSEILFLPP
jgi:hypothetical protein